MSVWPERFSPSTTSSFLWISIMFDGMIIFLPSPYKLIGSRIFLVFLYIPELFSTVLGL